MTVDDTWREDTCQECKPWGGAWWGTPGVCSICDALFNRAGDRIWGDTDICWQCDPLPGRDGTEERDPGWCARCGYFFDLHGMRLLEPWRACKVHSPIKSSCPHSGSLNKPT